MTAWIHFYFIEPVEPTNFSIWGWFWVKVEIICRIRPLPITLQVEGQKGVGQAWGCEVCVWFSKTLYVCTPYIRVYGPFIPYIWTVWSVYMDCINRLYMDCINRIYGLRHPRLAWGPVSARKALCRVEMDYHGLFYCLLSSYEWEYHTVISYASRGCRCWMNPFVCFRKTLYGCRIEPPHFHVDRHAPVVDLWDYQPWQWTSVLLTLTPVVGVVAAHIMKWVDHSYSKDS
jgi:hypothetical protein